QDCDICTNKAVLLDYDGLALIRALAAKALLRIDWNRRGEDADVRSDDAAVPNLDLRAIEDRTVAVNAHVLANRDVVPIVARERRGDHTSFTNVALWVNGRSQVRWDVCKFLGLQDIAEQA